MEVKSSVRHGVNFHPPLTDVRIPRGHRPATAPGYEATGQGMALHLWV